MKSPDLFDDESDNLALQIEAMNLERVKGTLDELFMLARHYRRSDKFLELMKFVASFKRYSAFNAMMVHIQMPGARYVLPVKRWLAEYGRMPISDAQPLIMLQPMSPIMFGFDVSQTRGRPLPAGFEDPFEAKGYLGGQRFEMTIANARRDGVSVTLRSLGSTMGGYVRDASSHSHHYIVQLLGIQRQPLLVDGHEIDAVADITLNANLPDSTNFATLTHELGHLYCGHVGTPNPKWWPDRRRLDRHAREFEAESVSYLVCHRAGIETPAAEYLYGYLRANGEVPEISLDAVFKAAQRIESMSLKKQKPRQLDERKT